MSAETPLENEISLLGKRVRLRQPEQGFRPGLDSVMLAAACPARPKDNILDLGCGVGSAGFCVLARVEDTVLTGVDCISDYIDCAKDNAVLNDMKDRADFFCRDIRDIQHSQTDFSSDKEQETPRSKAYASDDVTQNEGQSGRLFDHVICNPPFMDDGAHTRSPDTIRAAANGHRGTKLEDWIKCAFNNLKSSGSLTLIHRADMIDDIILTLGKSFGATEIIPLWPKEDVPAKRVIVRTLKHRKSPASIKPGIVLHEENGDYTQRADTILRAAESL
jgi:tRNA1(Val) A37 N6-methylase TrmN6